MNTWQPTLSYHGTSQKIISQTKEQTNHQPNLELPFPFLFLLYSHIPFKPKRKPSTPHNEQLTEPQTLKTTQKNKHPNKTPKKPAKTQQKPNKKPTKTQRNTSKTSTPSHLPLIPSHPSSPPCSASGIRCSTVLGIWAWRWRFFLVNSLGNCKEFLENSRGFWWVRGKTLGDFGESLGSFREFYSCKNGNSPSGTKHNHD